MSSGNEKGSRQELGLNRSYPSGSRWGIEGTSLTKKGRAWTRGRLIEFRDGNDLNFSGKVKEEGVSNSLGEGDGKKGFSKAGVFGKRVRVDNSSEGS